MKPDPPDAKAELEFLGNLRALLADGAFVSTYKYALLRALADECVEREETAGPLHVAIQRLGERFVELYWRQAKPYEAQRMGHEPAAAQLLQNTGPQAAVVNLVSRYQARMPLLSELQRDRRGWLSLTRAVAAVVKRMPLFKLQTIGGRKVEFLYPEEPAADAVTLRPGVAWLFRKHHDLVRDLIEMAWMRFIQSLPRNEALLGSGQELNRFLFGTDRRVLAKLGDALHARQGGRCFYCDRPIGGGVHVDHFIPWSRYSLDLGHNFVVSDDGCNLDKRTYLPAEVHVQRWIDRNLATGPALAREFVEAGMPCNLVTTLWVAQWAYSVDVAAQASTWVGRRKRIEPVRGSTLIRIGEAVRRATVEAGA